MFGKVLATRLVELNLVPELDPSGRGRPASRTQKPEARAKTFIDVMGRYGLLPRSVPPGYPAWSLHAAVEICEQRAEGLPVGKISLSSRFDTLWVLNDVGLAINYCSKLLDCQKALPAVLKRLRTWARGLAGADQEVVDQLWESTFSPEKKLLPSEQFAAFHRCIELRKQVLGIHEEQMRSAGWLRPPKARR